jgi:multiple sugar transport system permease protein
VGSSRVLAWPYLAGLALMIAIPMTAAFALAFTDYSGLQSPRFTGVDNFTRLLGDASFWRAAGNSLVYAVISVPLRVGGALAFALLLHQRRMGAGAARSIAYMPTVVPDVAYALLWLWLLNPLYGPLPLAVEEVGLTSPQWLTDPWAARVAVPVMGAFQIGEGFVIAIAARRLIPTPLYEAAAVEGAKAWFSFTRITLPLMAPVLALLALRDVVYSLQVNFIPALILTDGGPRNATTYLPVYVYRAAFRYFRLGYASTMALAMFVLTAVIVVIQYRLAKRWRLL